jgi:hypothetical protein
MLRDLFFMFLEQCKFCGASHDMKRTIHLLLLLFQVCGP